MDRLQNWEVIDLTVLEITSSHTINSALNLSSQTELTVFSSEHGRLFPNLHLPIATHSVDAFFITLLGGFCDTVILIFLQLPGHNFFLVLLYPPCVEKHSSL